MAEILGALKNALYPNYPVAFQTRYPLDAAVERLRHSVVQANFIRAFFSTFAPYDIASGCVKPKEVRLQRVRFLFANTFKPIFRGAFEERADAVWLIGAFTTSTFAKVLMTFWFGFVAVWTLITLLGVPMALLHHRPDVLVFPGFGVGMFAIGYWFVRFSWWISRRDIDFLSSIIADALGDS